MPLYQDYCLGILVDMRIAIGYTTVEYLLAGDSGLSRVVFVLFDQASLRVFEDQLKALSGS